MIIYLPCLCKSQYKLLAKKYRDMGYEVRTTKGKANIQKEIMQYQRTPPFIVERGISRPL